MAAYRRKQKLKHVVEEEIDSDVSEQESGSEVSTEDSDVEVSPIMALKHFILQSETFRIVFRVTPFVMFVLPCCVRLPNSELCSIVNYAVSLPHRLQANLKNRASRHYNFI